MATKLGSAPDYYTSFVNGQGVGASNYFVYASHLDVNFIAIKASLNAAIDEIQAVNGPAALIAFELATLTDVLGPLGAVPQGVLGGHSYVVQRNSATELEVSRGRAIINSGRVALDAVVTFSSITGDGTKYIALDSGGVPFLETAASQRSLDVAKITMTGGALLLNTLEQLATVYPDGDGHNDATSRDDESAVWATGAVGGAASGELDQGPIRAGYKVFRGLMGRFRAIERLLLGYSTEDDTDALPVLGIQDGSNSLPSLIATDGAGTRDTTTGWYRSAVNVWAFAASTVQRLTLGAYGIRTQNGSIGTPAIAATSDTDTGIRWGAALIGLVVAGADVIQLAAAQARLVAGVVGTPALTFISDTTTGWYRSAANVWDFSVSGVWKLQLAAQGIIGIIGAVGAPTYSFLGRLTTGLYSPAANVAGLAGGGELAIEAGSIAAGGVGLPNKLRARASNYTGAQTIGDSAWEAIDLDVSTVFEVGEFHDTGTNPSRMTIPTNGDGLYHVEAHANFDAQNLNGYIGIRLALNGTGISATEQVMAVSRVGDNGMQTGAYLDLVATDYVEVEAFEASSGTVAVEAVLTVVRTA